jgi:hypothetical protein
LKSGISQLYELITVKTELIAKWSNKATHLLIHSARSALEGSDATINPMELGKRRGKVGKWRCEEEPQSIVMHRGARIIVHTNQ